MISPGFYLVQRPIKALSVPAAYAMSQNAGNDAFLKTGKPGAIEDCYKSGLLIISRGTAILLLVYVAYLVFQLKAHADLFQAPEGQEEKVLEMNPLAAGTALLSVTLVTSFTADYRE